MYSVGIGCRVPGNAGGDDLSARCIEDMGVQSEGREAFSLLVLWVPEIFELGTPFAEATDSLRVACRVDDEGVTKNGLSEHLGLSGRFSLKQARSDIQPSAQNASPE
jgi:hypothetical protein